MELTINTLDSALTVSVSGRLDTAGAPVFESRLLDALSGTQARALVVDLAGCSYVSSAGLSAVVAVGRDAHRLGVTLSFCALSPEVKEVFDISGMLPLFPVADTLQKALGAVRA